jgi:hypothetical protein
MENTLATSGKGIAGGSVFRLYRDIAAMYAQLSHSDPDKIAEWTRRMTAELVTYCERMNSMLVAAVNQTGLDEIVERFAGEGLSTRIREIVAMGPDKEPAAWALVCERR